MDKAFPARILARIDTQTQYIARHGEVDSGAWPSAWACLRAGHIYTSGSEVRWMGLSASPAKEGGLPLHARLLSPPWAHVPTEITSSARTLKMSTGRGRAQVIVPETGAALVHQHRLGAFWRLAVLGALTTCRPDRGAA